jgi:hypothetical protein
MSVTPAELWAHAQSLPQKTEAEIRTKISRLYYALYSHAFEFNTQLPSQGILLRRDGGSHSQLAQKLTNPTVDNEALKAVSCMLGTMQKLAHELRVKADYQLSTQISANDLAKCERFVTRGMEVDISCTDTRAVANGSSRPTITPIR